LILADADWADPGELYDNPNTARNLKQLKNRIFRSTQNLFRIRSRQNILADLKLRIEIFYQNYGTEFDRLIKRKKAYY
jgi:hypothetical protein